MGAVGYGLGHGAIWFSSPQWLALIFRVALAVVGLLLLRGAVFRQFLRWAQVRAVVTNRRLLVRFDRRGRIGWDVPLLAIADIRHHRGLMQRVVGAGSLIITSPMTGVEAVIPDVPAITDCEAAILELHAQAWADYRPPVAYQGPP